MAQLNTDLKSRLNALSNYLQGCKSTDTSPNLLEPDIDDLLYCVAHVLQPADTCGTSHELFSEVLEEAANSIRLDDVRRDGVVIHTDTSEVDGVVVTRNLTLYGLSLYLITDKYTGNYPTGHRENIQFAKIQ